jgi:hypothetical protein
MPEATRRKHSLLLRDDDPRACGGDAGRVWSARAVSDSCKPEESPPGSSWRLGFLGDAEEFGNELPHLLA